METSEHLTTVPETSPLTPDSPSHPSSRPSSPNGILSSPLLSSEPEAPDSALEAHTTLILPNKEFHGAVRTLDPREEAKRLASDDGGPCCRGRGSPIVRQVIATLVVCFSGSSVGCVFSFPAVAAPYWTQPNSTLPLEPHHVSWITTAPLAVCIPLCTLGGVVVEFFGVRLVAIFCSFFLACSWIIICLAESYAYVIAGRVLQGMLIAILLVVVVVYPSEVASVKRRGVLIAMNETLIASGSLLTYALGLFFSPSTIAMTFTCLLILQVPFLALVPDSPLWLLRTGRIQAALKSLRFFRGPAISAEDVEELLDSSQADKEQSKGVREQVVSLRKWSMLKPVLKSCFLFLFKELTGQYIVISYTVRLFQLAGSSLDSYWCSFVMGMVKIVASVLVWGMIERFPRRCLLTGGFLVAGLAMSGIGLYLWSPHLGMSQEVLTSFGWLPLVCVLVYVASYSAIAPSCWLVAAEILPSEIRNLGCGIVSTFFSITNFGVSLSFLSLVRYMGTGGTFFFYSTFSLVGAIFVLAFLQETRGKTFGDIQKDAEGVHAHLKKKDIEDGYLASSDQPEKKKGPS